MGEGDFGRSTAKNDRQHMLAGKSPCVIMLSFPLHIRKY